jgi:hypothetical protein
MFHKIDFYLSSDFFAARATVVTGSLVPFPDEE